MKICATLLLTKKIFCALEKFLQKTLDKTGWLWYNGAARLRVLQGRFVNCANCTKILAQICATCTLDNTPKMCLAKCEQIVNK